MPRPGGEPADAGSPGLESQVRERAGMASRAGRAIGIALRGAPPERPVPVLLADVVADSVLRAVGSFSSERDDVALLILAAT